MIRIINSLAKELFFGDATHDLQANMRVISNDFFSLFLDPYFMHNKQHVLSLGFDKIFIRKWLYDLCYCEAGFLKRNIGDVPIVFTKPGYRSI